MVLPQLLVKKVKKRTTLRKYLDGLNKEYSRAFEKGFLGVVVNGKPSDLDDIVKCGDEIIVFHVISGG
jgi:molybdopterin converting factor small subunit